VGRSSTAASRLRAFVRLGRPLFLGGGFLMFGLGTALSGRFHLQRYLLGQLAVTAFQLMTHYANDYFDYAADCANTTPTRWSGGSRVLPDGELPREVALAAALAFAAVGTVTAAVLAAIAGAWTLAALAAIALLAWEYSAPPLRLCARGLGELATAVVVTVLVPWLGYALQASPAPTHALAAAVVPPALLQIAMLLAIEIPDRAGDAACSKRTLVVRLGAARAARLYATVTALAYLWLPLAAALALLPARVALAAALPAPLAAWRIARIARDLRDRTAYERLAFFAVLLLVATAACELVALLVPGLWHAA